MRKLTLSLAVMAALLPVHGYSLGLGELELNSALNQELDAEIQVLSAASEDAEQIIIKLAGREAFSRAGLDRPFLLQQLKFKIVDKNGVPYVRVYTKTPIREPYLSFLLEIDWPQGHLLREYTLLLDPPIYNTGDTSAASPGAETTDSSFNRPADNQVQTQPLAPQQQNAQAAQSSALVVPNVQTGVITSDTGRSVNYQTQALPVAVAVQQQPTSDQYRVNENDTLWGIANRMRPDSSVSVEQMMLALVRKNPEAFIRENINGVKRGYILRVPNRDETTALDRQQAVAQAREHAALWREYSHAASSASPASSMEAEEMGGMAADQPRDVDGHLSIVGASETGSEHAGSNQDPDSQLSKLKQDLAMANEQLESERLEKEDLRNRLAELEQRVQSVIENGRAEMDDAELAKLQADLQSSQQETDAVADVMPAEDVAAIAADETAEEEITTEESAADGISDEAVEEAVTEAEVATDEPAEDALFVDETEVATDDVAQTETNMPVAEPVEAIEVPAFAQTKPKSFVDSLMDDPKLLGMIGGGLAFIFLLVALLLKRIRGNKAEEESDWDAAMDDPATDLSDIDAELDTQVDDEATVQTEALDMDSTAEMIAEPQDDLGLDDTQIEAPDDIENLEDTVFSLDGNEAEPEEDERDDVIAEADVYLAYGIYQQAEELLNTAIDQNPERDDYRMKLLETHFAAKNVSGFEQLASDVKSRKGSDKTYWARVVAMGIELSPDSELFSGAEEVMADFDPEALLPGKPETDLVLDAGDEAETDFDLGLDDAELGLDDTFDEGDADATQILSEPLALDESSPLDDELDLAGDLDDIANEVTGEADTDTSSELEFDLGELDDMDDMDEPQAATETIDESAEMDIDDDFSLDFDASDLGFEESEDDEDTEKVTLDADLDLTESLDDEESVDESIGIDLSDDLEGDLEGDLGDDLSSDLDAELDVDLGDIDIDADDLDADLDLGDMELSDTELADTDLGDLDDSSEVSAEGDDEFDISELSEEIDEVSTKLDLAKAYIDMGDSDGARSILEEVKAEGNDEQQKQADELIQQAS